MWGWECRQCEGDGCLIKAQKRFLVWPGKGICQELAILSYLQIVYVALQLLSPNPDKQIDVILSSIWQHQNFQSQVVLTPACCEYT